MKKPLGAAVGGRRVTALCLTVPHPPCCGRPQVLTKTWTGFCLCCWAGFWVGARLRYIPCEYPIVKQLVLLALCARVYLWASAAAHRGAAWSPCRTVRLAVKCWLTPPAAADSLSCEETSPLSLSFSQTRTNMLLDKLGSDSFSSAVTPYSMLSNEARDALRNQPVWKQIIELIYQRFIIVVFF